MGTMTCYPKMRDRGQLTIPEDIRDGLAIEPGDQLRLEVEKLD